MFNICIVIKNKDNYMINEHVVLTKNEEKKLELNIDQNRKYKILAYFPETKYTSLNSIVKDKVSLVVSNFKNIVEQESDNSNQLYNLNITYDSYEYKNYISYAFYSELNVGGAHPTHAIWTIVYNIDTQEEIDIDKMIDKYPNFLKILSDYSRKILKKDPKITGYSMMINGTEPKKNNFNDFCFTDKGLIIFFNRYQVAPYSSGSFVITVPYNKFL